MCKAMNRSFTNVLFGAFGQVQQATGGGESRRSTSRRRSKAPRRCSSRRASVVIIPGYGMAVAQAQHKVRELYDQLKKRGITVKFAIHPVAGRMPGHMNVLLAEADIPYTDLVEMDEINPDMPQCDVALVVGANDVVNPAARTTRRSPIYGMPIIDADKARTVFAIKRSKNPGFAGIDNELYFARPHVDAVRRREERDRRAGEAARGRIRALTSEGLSPLGLPYTLSRAPLRRRASASAKAPARPRRSAYGAKAGRSRGSLAVLARAREEAAFVKTLYPNRVKLIPPHYPKSQSVRPLRHPCAKHLDRLQPWCWSSRRWSAAC